MKTRIYRKSYNLLGQNDLLAYAANVVRCCQGSPSIVAALPVELPALEAAVAEFTVSISRLANGGRLEFARKDTAKAAVLAALNRLCETMEYQNLGQEAVLHAGLTPVVSSVAPSGPLPAPEALRSTYTGTAGELDLSFRLLQPRRVYTNAVEYSADGGASWHNGRYTKRSRVRLNGLPSRQEVMFRVASIGREGRGPWSEAVTVFVL